MFAICEYGYYGNDYGISVIEIDKKDKELFRQYCLDSQKIDGQQGETLNLLGYSELNYREVINEINHFTKKLHIKCMTIQQHQQKIKGLLDYIPWFNNEWRTVEHKFSDKIGELNRLLEYKFRQI